MIEAIIQADAGSIPVDEAKEILREAVDLVRGIDPSGTVERFIAAQTPTDAYHVALSLLSNHEHIVDVAARDYARKYMPECCTTPEKLEDALESLADVFEYSWVMNDEPECHVRSPHNPNWEALYYFAVRMLPIGHAVKHGLSPYKEEDIEHYKARYGDLTLCMFCDSLVERPKVH